MRCNTEGRNAPDLGHPYESTCLDMVAIQSCSCTSLRGFPRRACCPPRALLTPPGQHISRSDDIRACVVPAGKRALSSTEEGNLAPREYLSPFCFPTTLRVAPRECLSLFVFQQLCALLPENAFLLLVLRAAPREYLSPPFPLFPPFPPSPPIELSLIAHSQLGRSVVL